MTAGNLLFALCAIACLAGAITTVSARNPIRGAMGLLTTVFGIAGLFLKLRAEFLTAIQMIVYAGAVVVLFVFVLMLLGPSARAPARVGRSSGSRLVGGGLFAIGSLWLLLSLGSKGVQKTGLGAVPPGYGSAEAVGGLLFSNAIFAFELATALLIVAVVGAIAVARGRQGAARTKRSAKSPLDFFAGPVAPRRPGRTLGSEGAE